MRLFIGEKVHSDTLLKYTKIQTAASCFPNLRWAMQALETQIFGPDPQSFQFNWCGLGPMNLHF